MKKPLILALTGGIGAGKSTVADLFTARGVRVIDTDKISHALTQPHMPATQKVIDHFGKDYQDEKGGLNRKKLRQKIFESPEDKKWLENLLHPLIYEKAKIEIKSIHAPYIIIVIPLLFETGVPDFIDKIIVVDCDEEAQIKRVSQRDQMNPEEIKKILAAQFPRKLRLQKADEVIINAGKMKDLEERVDMLHEKYYNK